MLCCMGHIHWSLFSPGRFLGSHSEIKIELCISVDLICEILQFFVAGFCNQLRYYQIYHYLRNLVVYWQTRHVFLHFFLTSRLVRQNAPCFWHFLLPHRFPQQALHERAQFFCQKGLAHDPFIIMLRHFLLDFKSLHCSIIIMRYITEIV